HSDRCVLADGEIAGRSLAARHRRRALPRPRLMPVQIVPIPVSDKALLWDELQKYILELTQWGTHQPIDGVFPYPWFDLYWTEPNRFAFWSYVDGVRAGFALVHREERTE